MIYSCLKWGAISITVGALFLTSWLTLHPAPLQHRAANGTVTLGDIRHFQIHNRGHLNFSLHSDVARETYPTMAGMLTTTLLSYYQLGRITFDCNLQGFGHTLFTASQAQMDQPMQKLRIHGPVFIRFESGYHSIAQRVDIDLRSGSIKTVALQMHIDGHTVPAGSRHWQMDGRETHSTYALPI